MKGEPVENVPESLRLFSLCEAMRWNHLPSAGGLYDQHPRLLEDWLMIFNTKAEHEKAEAEKRNRELGNKAGASKGRRGRRR